MALEIRPVTPAEWEAWRDLRLRALAESPGAFCSTVDREQVFTEREWHARMTPPALLAWRDGVPLAMGAGFVETEGWLQVVAMWTAPEARGEGLGSRILDQVVVWGREHDLRISLHVALDNPAARRVYEAYGFVPTGEVIEYDVRPGMRVERLDLPVGRG
jgi:RimJ/RimL family protein N-acetyltransferase